MCALCIVIQYRIDELRNLCTGCPRAPYKWNSRTVSRQAHDISATVAGQRECSVVSTFRCNSFIAAAPSIAFGGYYSVAHSNRLHSPGWTNNIMGSSKNGNTSQGKVNTCSLLYLFYFRFQLRLVDISTKMNFLEDGSLEKWFLFSVYSRQQFWSWSVNGDTVDCVDDSNISIATFVRNIRRLWI